MQFLHFTSDFHGSLLFLNRIAGEMSILSIHAYNQQGDGNKSLLQTMEFASKLKQLSKANNSSHKAICLDKGFIS
ncbi:hypothetical protein RB195_019057 [Necator americanus]|uniref:Kinesin motor domain-containing protein n=1 Tax=Necator americanus TaxID=51031 RepID=A0ABR1CG04_NECAM